MTAVLQIWILSELHESETVRIRITNSDPDY